MKTSSRQFRVYLVQALWRTEPCFLPQLLYDTPAGLGSGWRRLSLGESGVFHVLRDRREDPIDGGLQLVLLRFDFEFYVADFHLDFDGRLLRGLCQVGTY